MYNALLEHVPIKLETIEAAVHFGECSLWKAATTTTATDTKAALQPTPATITSCSSASSISSRTAANLENEIESCGNVFILNRRKLFLICGFCDSKYANLLQFAKHLNDCHKIFSSCDDDLHQCSGAASEAESDSDASAMTGLIVKGGFQIRFVREGSASEESPTIPTPPLSVDDTLLKHVPIKVEEEAVDDNVTMVDENSTSTSNFEDNIESCGNIFIMYRRKLFLICGFCEGKYASMELFATHLHECHTVFQDDDQLESIDDDVAVKKEPEETLLLVNRIDTNNENAPPMVAIPSGTNVDNEDIIPQEEVMILVAAAAPKEKIELVNEEAVSIPQPPETATVCEKKVLQETRRQRKSASKDATNTKTIKDFFCKAEESSVSKFPCKQCPKTFNKVSRLTEHVRLHTGEKPFKCEECGKSFRIKLRMNEHLLRHRSEKAYICEVCGLGLATRQDYSLHQRHHNGDKRYVCQECGKAFVRSSDLKTHHRIHSDERPFKCEICNLTFRANQNLIIHRRVHQGDKQFKCDYCDKRFLRKIDKRVHHRTHTGEKAFKCEICGRGYSAKVHVRRHIQKRHMDPLKYREMILENANVTKQRKKSNKSFMCDICPKMYSSKVSLQKHVKQIHENSPTNDLKQVSTKLEVVTN